MCTKKNIKYYLCRIPIFLVGCWSCCSCVNFGNLHEREFDFGNAFSSNPDLAFAHESFSNNSQHDWSSDEDCSL